MTKPRKAQALRGFRLCPPSREPIVEPVIGEAGRLLMRQRVGGRTGGTLAVSGNVVWITMV